jgi:hypothetical protein
MSKTQLDIYITIDKDHDTNALFIVMAMIMYLSTKYQGPACRHWICKEEKSEKNTYTKMRNKKTLVR